MKKMLSVILCIMLVMSSLCFAMADEVDEVEPTTENGAEAEAAAPEDYVIRAFGGSKVLTVSADGAGFTMADYNPGSRAQLWRITDGGVIYNRINNRAVTVDSGIVLAANKGLDTQKWSVTEEGMIAYNGGGYLSIDGDENIVLSEDGTVWEILTPAQIAGVAAESTDDTPVTIGGTMVMVLDGTTTVLCVGSDNVTLTTAPYKIGTNNQFWSFVKNGDAYNISSSVTKTYIDVSGNSLSPGGQLILWSGTGGDNQKWEVEQENGKCYLKSKLSGLYMTANEGWITQQNKANASAWKLMSLDEINAAYLAETGNSEAFENNRRLLENLGIVDASGTYGENDMVSKRDAVTFAVKLITGGSEFSEQLTGFADVSADDEVSGYAYQAVILGMIDQTTMLYPDNAAKADEFIESIFRGLNYADIAKISGGYMGLANQKGILKGVSAFENNTLTYGQMFKILVNALSVELFSYSNSVVVLQSKELIESRWNIEVLKKAEITEASRAKGTFTAVYDGETYNFQIPINYLDVELKGRYAEIWIDKNDDEVLSIDFYSGYTVKYGYITAVNGVEDSAATFNPYLVKNFNLNYEKSKYKPASDAVITVNGKTAFGGAVPMVNSFARVVSQNGTVRYIDIYEMTEGGLFRNTDGKDITFLRGAMSNVKIKDIDDKDEVVVVLNNKPATIEGIPYNALVDYCETDDMLFITAYVDIASGFLESIEAGGYNIDGNIYEPTNVYGKVYYSYDMGETYAEDSSSVSGYFNSGVTAYLDVCGNIRYIRGEKSSDGIIGVITAVDLGMFDKVNSITVFSDYSGVMSTQTFELKLSTSSDVSEKDIAAIADSGNADNTMYEFRIAGGKVTKITELDWLICSDNSKALVSSAVRGTLVSDYGEERVDELFDDPNIFITGWTMGRDATLSRIHFYASTDEGNDYTLMCSGFNTRYIMAYDSDGDFRPREISWYDYRNTNFDRSFLKVGFLKDNTEKMFPDVVYILSSNKYVAVSSWDVHGVVNRVLELSDDTYTIELIEPGDYIGTYIIENSEDIYGYYDGVRPSKGDVVTLTARGNYEKVYYNVYGEEIPEEEAWELEDEGEYVELVEEYRTNGYASVAKVWDMPNEIGKFNNEYSITYVDNIYKIDGNLMYYRDSSTGAIQPYYSVGGNLFIMEDSSKYIMYDYDDIIHDRFDETLTLDDISTESQGGESDKLLIFSVSRGRYPKVIIRMPSDWEP